MIKQMPAIPAATPNNLRNDGESCRATASVRKNVNIGEVELRMVASPASTERSAQAIKVQGTTLLRQAWNMKRRQSRDLSEDASLGRPSPAATIRPRSTFAPRSG